MMMMLLLLLLMGLLLLLGLLLLVLRNQLSDIRSHRLMALLGNTEHLSLGVRPLHNAQFTRILKRALKVLLSIKLRVVP